MFLHKKINQLVEAHIHDGGFKIKVPQVQIWSQPSYLLFSFFYFKRIWTENIFFLTQTFRISKQSVYKCAVRLTKTTDFTPSWICSHHTDDIRQHVPSERTVSSLGTLSWSRLLSNKWLLVMFADAQGLLTSTSWAEAWSLKLMSQWSRGQNRLKWLTKPIWTWPLHCSLLHPPATLFFFFFCW